MTCFLFLSKPFFLQIFKFLMYDMGTVLSDFYHP
uniref:Uncharacterized protein n=1 Tax=Anguilla anguilla TaxID=7936 RepID=A0A0E9QLB9_ANGAN